MKCPKCRYITFDEGDRCRNCGYDFSLSVDATDLDLPIKTGDEALGPLADFDLGTHESSTVPLTPAPSEPTPQVSRRARAPELPLFVDRGLDDDRPLVSLPASPRAPVAVRKSTAARGLPQRAPAEEPELDLEAPAAPRRPITGPPAQRQQAQLSTARQPEERPAETSAAPVGARLLGAVIDAALLGAIDVTVLYLTLRLSELEFADAARIPLVPFAAFVALLNGGYMAAFTAAGGQSIGKMAAGTRVVTADETAWTDRVPLGQAIVRAAGYLLSALPAGLGFLPALFSADGRAVHDRLAHTRVVKA